MKKLQLLIGSLFFCLVSVLLVACNEAPPKTITSVTANNLQQFYYIEQEIDFNAVTLTVAYSDNTTKLLENGEVDIEESAAQEDTEFILHTNGLSLQQTLQEGTYNITCTLIGEQEPRALMTVTVDTNMSHVYDLVSFGVPDFVRTYNQNLENMIGTEDGFALKDTQYIVGDDNPFFFEPEFAVLPIEGDLPEVKNIKVDVTLTENDTPVDDEVYTFDNNTYGITFKNDGSAVDHTFKLSMKPTDWQRLEDGSNILPVEFTFTVKDGWNAYEAEDLGRMSISDPTVMESKDFKREVPDHGANFFKEDGSNAYEQISFYKLWNEYFSKKYGEEALKPINGLYLHGNIEVTENDLPEKYRITQEEVDAVQPGAQSAVGTARDYSYIYTKYLEDDKSFNLNGNYFKVDFTKFALNRSHMNSAEGVRHLEIYPEENPNPGFGYSIAFVFSGEAKSISPEMISANVDMRNIQLVGNAGKALTGEEVEKSAGSLMMVYSAGAVKVHCDNSIVQEALNGFNIEVGWENLNLSNSKVFNCFTAGIYNWGSQGNIITNSVLKNFGGAVIITTSTAEKRGEESQPTGNPGSKSSISIDDKSITECWIAGDEAWYSLTGGGAARFLATKLKESDHLWNEEEKGKKTILKDGKVNVIMIALDDAQLDATHDYLFSTLDWTKENEADPERAVKFDTAPMKTLCDNAAVFMGGTKPAIIQDCKGNTAATDLDKTALFVNPSASSLQFVNAKLQGDRLYMRLPTGGTSVAIVIGMDDYVEQA